MTKTYTFKQIIFALRREYLKVERQLIELRQYVTTSDKIKDFDFRLAGNPCKLFLHLSRKKNLLDKIEMSLGIYIHGMTNFDVTENIETSYCFRGKVICSIDNQEEINEKIRRIVQSNFSQNIVANNYISIPCVENQLNTLLIEHDGIISDSYPYFNYNSHRDEIYMKKEDEIITSDDIYGLLDLSIDSIYLDNYHCNVIDNYEDKKVIIDDKFTSNEVSLKIVEEPKRLILRPLNDRVN